MNFELNKYNQNISDKELLDDVKKVSDLLGTEEYLSLKKYSEHGQFSETVYRKRFGSWLKVLEILGLRTERTSKDLLRISDEELIQDIINVSRKVKKTRITYNEYREHGKYSMPTIVDRFGTWAQFIEKAGLDETGFIKKIETNDLFIEIERIWSLLGRQPTTTDMKKGISKYSLDTFTRRFGGWRNALQEFLNNLENDNPDLIELNSELKDLSINKNEEFEVEKKDISLKIKRTPRNINLKLRFKVLLRDSFSCCYCGASPAKDPSVELHVDHVLPWSQGGETILDNLKTSCSKCNLGKGNLKH